MKAELVLGNLKREREALNGKLERLETALSKEWQDEDQEYLCTQQYNAMCLYAHILDERIVDIEIKLEEKKMMAQDAASHETSHVNESMFNKNIDADSCKDYTNNSCSEKECEEDCPEECIITIIKGIFGDDLFEF